jgi:glycosyltransferase involved in cell wall biosynthesis
MMIERLNIGIFTPHYPSQTEVGGIGTYTRNLARGLVELGHRVHVLTIESAKYGRAEANPDDGVKLHVMRTGYLPFVERWLPNARAAWQISAAARKLSRDCNLDIFEFPNWEGSGRFFRCGMKGKTRLLVRLHTSFREILSLGDSRMSFSQRFACNLEKKACAAADSIYVSTHAHRMLMCNELGLAPERVSIVPLGIEDVASPAARKVRPRSNTPTVFYIGRLEPRKGTLDLLHAIPTLVKRVPDVRVILAGRDRPLAPGHTTYAEYFKRTFAPALQKHVEFTGFISDAAAQRWLEQADLFVAPSLYESFGLIFAEAMRWSLPVVGTMAGGIPEVVQHGVDGLLVPPKSPQKLADALATLLENDDLRQQMGANARRTYETNFTHEIMVRRTVEHYRAMLNLDPQPSFAA